jgi:TonB family protein
MRLHWLTILLAVIGEVLSAAPVKTKAVELIAPQDQVLVTRAVPALYPILAAVAGESGAVIVEVKIKSDGTVAEASAVDGHKLFKAAAEKSAYQWTFNSVAEQNVFRVVRLTFSFKLFPKTANAETLLPVFLPPYSIEIRGAPPAHSYPKDVDPPMKTDSKQQLKRKRS